jgi:hypothetical protein
MGICTVSEQTPSFFVAGDQLWFWTVHNHLHTGLFSLARQLDHDTRLMGSIFTLHDTPLSFFIVLRWILVVAMVFLIQLGLDSNASL